MKLALFILSAFVVASRANTGDGGSPLVEFRDDDVCDAGDLGLGLTEEEVNDTESLDIDREVHSPGAFSGGFVAGDGRCLDRSILMALHARGIFETNGVDLRHDDSEDTFRLLHSHRLAAAAAIRDEIVGMSSGSEQY